MKNTHLTLLAGAILAAWGLHARAQTAETPPPKVVVTANPLGSHGTDQILTPARVLSGDELRDKLGSSLGETLSQELGVSASGFGAGASRPIIRGLEGSRIKMLENGMSVADVSGLSNDHAVGAESSTARQIEILRGPAALLYGSGAIGGLVNVVNERIPTALPEHATGELEARYGSADRGRSLSGSADAAAGKLALHADGNRRLADDYRIAGPRELGNPASESGRLPHSFTDSSSGGFGASLIGSWGHAGASVSTLDNRYGIPTLEGAQIAQRQTRYDVDSLVKRPLAGLETVKFKLGYTDYAHSELDLEGMPETRFTNRSFETRLEAAHEAIGGWHGSVGLQTENTHFAAVSAQDATPDTVKPTHSTTAAVFVVEERDFDEWQVNAGLRHERVQRKPQLAGSSERSFRLTSSSVGAAYTGLKGYTLGLTGSIAQRAPAIEELYSSGPHDATATFDIGNPQLRKETSRNLELSLGNTAGPLRWKANLFYNKVHDFIYGYVPGRTCDEEGVCAAGGDGELRERQFSQGDVTIHGVEAELSRNWRGSGLSWRAFADMSQGRFANGGSLPLQPPKRLGADLAYKAGPVRAGATLVHAFAQNRLAAFETGGTPAYTQLDAHASYTQRFEGMDLTWFALVRNALNDEIRLSTSILKDVAPQPGRSVVVGVRTRF